MKQQQQQKQHQMPILDFDKKILQQINHKCLKADEKITLEYQGHFYFEDDEPHEEELFEIRLKKNNKTGETKKKSKGRVGGLKQAT